MHPKIIVVDDDCVQRTLVSIILRRAGYEQLELFHSPLEALRYAQFIWTDLLITDYQMRECTGAQLIRKIARFRPDLPAIIVTGSQDTLPLPSNCAVVRKTAPDYRRSLIKQVHCALEKSGYDHRIAYRNYSSIHQAQTAKELSALRMYW